MNHHATRQRTAFSLAEVADMFGRHRSWAYRLARSGKLKTIKGFGYELVPSSEIDRIPCGSPKSEERAQ